MTEQLIDNQTLNQLIQVLEENDKNLNRDERVLKQVIELTAAASVHLRPLADLAKSQLATVQQERLKRDGLKHRAEAAKGQQGEDSPAHREAALHPDDLPLF